MSFFIEVLAGGLLAGVMYSLVALGFVLIYKASGVFNFAQGAMVFFAGLTFVLEGLSQLLWGSQPHNLELGIPDVPMEWLSEKANINISQFDIFGALVAGALVAG